MPTDACDAVMSVKALLMEVWSDLVILLLAGWVIGPLTYILGGDLACGMTITRLNALSEVCAPVVIIVIALESVALVSFAIDTRISADVDANLLATLSAVSEYAEVLASSSTALRCLPIATLLDCRASQAWMPSYHVC